MVQGDKIVKKYGQHNHDTNPVQKRVREEDQTPEEGGEPQHDQAEERGAGKENNVSTAPKTSRNLSRDPRRHDLKSLVAQFESMATNLFMESLIDRFLQWYFVNLFLFGYMLKDMMIV